MIFVWILNAMKTCIQELSIQMKSSKDQLINWTLRGIFSVFLTITSCEIFSVVMKREEKYFLYHKVIVLGQDIRMQKSFDVPRHFLKGFTLKKAW